MPARSTDNPALAEGVFTKRSQSAPPAGLLAGAWLTQNSHRGSATLNAPVHQGVAFSKALHAKGLPDPLYDFRVRPRCSGKERDVETGLDYFGARYYGSPQGRWTIPDWSSMPEPVPYAELVDPQTLNLYAYVRNSPLGSVDQDGHANGPLSRLGCAEDEPDCKPNPAMQVQAGQAQGSAQQQQNATIGALPESRGNPTRERADGFVKGALRTIFEAMRMIGAPDANVDQAENALHLDPTTRNEKFGGEVFTIVLALIPGGEGEAGAVWHEGSFDSAAESLAAHFGSHGGEVGAASVEQYLSKATEFAKNLKGATKRPVEGFTEGVMRYSKSGRYVDLAPDGRIVSFGTTQ